MDFSIRKANVNELDAVFSVYANAIVTMNENNILQWDEVYPSKQDIMEDIQGGQLYLVESDQNIVSVFVLNQDFDEEYELGKWDAFSQNPYALRMYEKLNYHTVGEVQWRKDLFYLMEKKL
ncbi:hypothetical protein D3C78_1200430 [compost metagenome]